MQKHMEKRCSKSPSISTLYTSYEMKGYLWNKFADMLTSDLLKKPLQWTDTLCSLLDVLQIKHVYQNFVKGGGPSMRILLQLCVKRASIYKAEKSQTSHRALGHRRWMIDRLR